MQAPGNDCIIQVDGVTIAKKYACYIKLGSKFIEMMCTVIMPDKKELPVHVKFIYSIGLPTISEFLKKHSAITLHLQGKEINNSVDFDIKLTYSISKNPWTIVGSLGSVLIDRSVSNPFALLSLIGESIQQL